MSHHDNPPFPAGRFFRPGNPAALAAALAFSVLFLNLTACSKSPETTADSAQKTEVAAEAPTPESELAKAATRGDLARVKALIDEGANVNVTDALGRTPLHMTAFYGRPKTAAHLIASGANVNAKDRVGMTPLHAAVLAGGQQEVELLLDKKADIKVPSEIGLTPLHLAAATGQPQLAALLLQHGADPKSKDREGNTPLALATKNNHRKTAALLQQTAGKP